MTESLSRYNTERAQRAEGSLDQQHKQVMSDCSRGPSTARRRAGASLRSRGLKKRLTPRAAFRSRCSLRHRADAGYLLRSAARRSSAAEGGRSGASRDRGAFPSGTWERGKLFERSFDSGFAFAQEQRFGKRLTPRSGRCTPSVARRSTATGCIPIALYAIGRRS